MSADCRPTVTVRPARDAAEAAAAQDLRVRVFCDEQGVALEEELDGLDDDAVQIVALDESGVVATCRLRFVGEACKLERMAVGRRLRGLGVGTRLLAAAEDEARAAGARTVLLHAQRRVEGFYATGGYAADGETFMEAGIEHVAMRKEFR
ncbi:MAG TPA: GNAT family N-acetyltransferase [Solirubrobacterales bacterium]